MGKTIAAILIAAAFFYAVYLLARKRRVSAAKLAGSGRYRKIFLTAAVSIMSVLAGASGCKNGEKDTGTDIPRTAPAEAGQEDPVITEKPAKLTPAEKAWSELSQVWRGIFAEFEIIEKSGDSYEKKTEAVEAMKKNHASAAQTLVDLDEIDKESSQILDNVYSDILAHRLRSSYGAKCYKMSALGGINVRLKSDVTERIEKLKGYYDAGVIKEEAAGKITAAIAKDIAFLNKIEEIFESEAGTKPKQVEKLEELINDSKHIIEKNDPSFKAAEIIIRLFTKTGEAKPQAGADKSKNWIVLGDLWEELVAKNKDKAWDQRQKYRDKLDKNIEDHDKLVGKMVDAGELKKDMGAIMITAYDEISQHVIRLNSMKTCYDMTMTGVFVMEVKDGAHKRIESLKKFIDEGALSKDAAEKIKAIIARDIYFLGKINSISRAFKTDKDWKTLDNKISDLKKFYDDNKHVIAKTDPSYKLADIIIDMMTKSSVNN